jgi:hypothetical protein
MSAALTAGVSGRFSASSAAVVDEVSGTELSGTEFADARGGTVDEGVLGVAAGRVPGVEQPTSRTADAATSITVSHLFVTPASSSSSPHPGCLGRLTVLTAGAERHDTLGLLAANGTTTLPAPIIAEPRTLR